MMKTLFLPLLFALASVLSAATITLEPATITISPGSAVILGIDVSGISDLYAWQFDVGFTPGVLSASDIQEGSFLSGGGTTFFVPGTINNADGTLAFTADTLLGAIPGVNGNGLLATVMFQALSAGTSQITISNVILLDSTLSVINAATTNASVTVQDSNSTAPEPATWSLLGLSVGLALLRKRRVA